MPYRVLSFERTPNPDALICVLDAPVSDRPRSFLKPEDAAGDPLGASLMAVPGMRAVLMNGARVTINKFPEADWRPVKAGARAAFVAGS